MFAFIAAVATSTALAGAPPAPPERLLVEVFSRVEVDANGAIVAIEPPPKMEPELKAAVEANIRKLHFSPPILKGQPVTGSTWVGMQVCSTQVGTEHQQAMRFTSNGPNWMVRTSPVYPVEAEMLHGTARFVVVLDLAPNGKAKLVHAKPLEVHGHLRAFLRSLEIWADEQRYRPQMVAGQPVGDRFTQEVNYVLRDSVHVAELDAEQRRIEEEARVAEEKRVRDGCEAIFAGTPSEPNYNGTPADDRVVVRP